MARDKIKKKKVGLAEDWKEIGRVSALINSG
jgi:hypothetical protein